MDEPSQTSDTLFMTLDPMATISAAAPSGIDFDFISGYTPLSLLGTGGVGVVHLTRQESVRRQVAVKWVRPDGPRPMQARQSLLQEAHAAAALEHPNVVPVYDLIQDAEQGPGVVMRRITGRTWSEYLGSPDAVRDDFGARDTVEWHIGVLEQVCNALHFAHSRGIIHRDLKPDNVMIGRFGEVYVLDWGLAARLSVDGPFGVPLAAQDMRLVGTPCFMPPEMASANGALLGIHTDVYLLCALLHYILTGRGPHAGETVKEVLASIPKFELDLPEDMPGTLVSLLERGLSGDVSSRPASADAVRLELLSFREARGVESVVAEARAHLVQLKEQLGADDIDREALYRSFGAVRFGFRQALKDSPEHSDASAGLREVLELMARWELEQGDPRAAEAILVELDQAPDDLAALHSQLLEQRAEEAARSAAALADGDRTAGQRTRIFVVGVAASFWLGTPWILALCGVPFGMPNLIGGHLVHLLLVLGLLYWGRESFQRSALNRGVGMLLLAVQTSSLVCDVGFLVSGRSAEEAFTSCLVVYGAICVAARHVISPWMMLPAVAQWGAFLIGCARPELVQEVSTVAHALTVITVFAAWWPEARGELLRSGRSHG